MREIEYIEPGEDLDAPVTWRDLEYLLEKLQSLCRQEAEPETIIQIKEH